MCDRVACGHATCKGLLDVRPCFHVNFSGPFRKLLRAHGLLTADLGDVGLFSAWWPPRGPRSSLPPSALVHGRRGVIEFMRPGACNVLTDKRRLAEFLESAGLTAWAPFTVQSPLDPFDLDERLWFLKHARLDDNEGVAVFLGRAAMQEAWLALPQEEQADYVAQREVARPFLDPSLRKCTFRVYIVLGVIPSVAADEGSSGPSATAWCLYRSNFSCRTHPAAYDASVAEPARHVHSGLGKQRGVGYMPGNEVFSESELETVIWPELKRMLAECARPVLQALLKDEAVGPGGVGQLAIDMLGVDFLLDADLRPWLLEFNQKPNLLPVPSQARVTAAREAVVEDLLALVVGTARTTGCLQECMWGNSQWQSLVHLTGSED